MGPGWAVCPWQHWLGSVLQTLCQQPWQKELFSFLLWDTSQAKPAGVYSMPKPLWLLRSSWLSLLHVQEVLHSGGKGSICRSHHGKSRTFPHTQGNILSCWQNSVSDLEVQMPSWKGRRFSWFNTVITSHKYILAWVGRLHKEVASLCTPTGLNFGK